jgi:hypothetical protein
MTAQPRAAWMQRLEISGRPAPASCCTAGPTEGQTLEQDSPWGSGLAPDVGSAWASTNESRCQRWCHKRPEGPPMARWRSTHCGVVGFWVACPVNAITSRGLRQRLRNSPTSGRISQRQRIRRRTCKKPWRRGWDSNPRWLLTTPLFESGTFNHSDTSPGASSIRVGRTATPFGRSRAGPGSAGCRSYQ